MDSVIDKKIKVPLHYQIYLDLLKKIQNGLLKPGGRIPSEPELERIYDVSRVTVRGGHRDVGKGRTGGKEQG